MPLLFQKRIDKSTAAAVWKIEEDENFFLQKAPLLQAVHHPHKRLQHLAGRYLLALLAPGFPFHDIRINEARKPYLPSQQYLFSISHCSDYAAVIISTQSDCGIDIELISPKTEKVKTKFLSEGELRYMQWIQNQYGWMFRENELFTFCWCVKEAVYKWWGNGKVDFRQHIRIVNVLYDEDACQVIFQNGVIEKKLLLRLDSFDELVIAWTTTSKKD